MNAEGFFSFSRNLGSTPQMHLGEKRQSNNKRARSRSFSPISGTIEPNAISGVNQSEHRGTSHLSQFCDFEAVPLSTFKKVLLNIKCPGVPFYKSNMSNIKNCLADLITLSPLSDDSDYPKVCLEPA